MPVIQQTGDLTPLEWLAVQLVGKEASAHRSEVPVGKEQEVDLLLRIKGKVNVGVPGNTTKHVGLKPDVVLALVLKHLQVETRDAVKQAILATCDSNGMPPAVEEGYLAQARTLISCFDRTESIPRAGSTSGVFQIGQVELQQLSQAVSNAVLKHTRAIALEPEEET